MKLLHDRTRPFPMFAFHRGVLGLLLLITLFWLISVKAQTLTGAVLFAAKDSGEYSGWDDWRPLLQAFSEAGRIVAQRA